MSTQPKVTTEAVYTFIHEYKHQCGCGPTVRKMCAGLEIGRSTLYRHLDMLEIEGQITREPGGARGIGLPDDDST